MADITDKSRNIMGRTLEFVNQRYGDVIASLQPELDRFDLMPVTEPMIRVRQGMRSDGKACWWSCDPFKSRKGKKPRTWRDYR